MVVFNREREREGKKEIHTRSSRRVQQNNNDICFLKHFYEIVKKKNLKFNNNDNN